MTKRDLGGTPKKRTRFTAMLRDKIYAGFYKKIPVQDLMGGCTLVRHSCCREN